MAQADSSLSKNVEQELTCAVCCELYSCPLLLPCSHSFCKKCVQDLMNNEDSYSHNHDYNVRFKCPVCRTAIRSGISSLPENLALTNLVSVLKTDGDGDGRTVSATQPIPPLNSTKCWKHPDNDLDMYCVYCLKAFCDVCPKLKCDSEQHWLKPLDVQWRTTWESLTELASEMDDRKSSLSDRLQLLDDQLAAVNVEEETTKSELTAEIEVLKSILMSRLTRLITDLHSEVQDVKYPLSHDRQKCATILDRLERLSGEMQELHRCNNGVKSVKRITELEKEISHLVRQESRDMLQLAIPVVTMPTWKLVRSPVEAAIRNLIVRRTNSVAKDSVSRVEMSPTRPMRTSPDHIPQPRSTRGELVTDVTMWTSSTQQPQVTRQTPCSSRGRRATRVKVTAQRSSASASSLSTPNRLLTLPTGADSSSPNEDTSASASLPSALADCYNSMETSLKKLEVSAKHFTYKGSELVVVPKMLKTEAKGFRGFQTTFPNSFSFGSMTSGTSRNSRIDPGLSLFQAQKQWGSVTSAQASTFSVFGSSSNSDNFVDFSGRGTSSSPRRFLRSGRNRGSKLNFTNGDPFSTIPVPEVSQPNTSTLGSSTQPFWPKLLTGQSKATERHFPTGTGSFNFAWKLAPAAEVPHSGPERSNFTVTPHLPEQPGRNIDVNFTGSNSQRPGVFFSHPDSASQETINTGISQHFVPNMSSLLTNVPYVDNTVTVMSPGYGLPLSTSIPGSSVCQPVAFSAQPHAVGSGYVLSAPSVCETTIPTDIGSCSENVYEASMHVHNSAIPGLSITAAAATTNINTATPTQVLDSATTPDTSTATLSASTPTQVPDSATTLNTNTATLSSSTPTLTPVPDSATTPNTNTATLSSNTPTQTQVLDSATTLSSNTATASSIIPTFPNSATTLGLTMATTLISSTARSETTVNNGPDVRENSYLVSCSSGPVQPSDSRCSTPCKDEQFLSENHLPPPLFTDSDSGVIQKEEQYKDADEAIPGQKSVTDPELFVNKNNSSVMSSKVSPHCDASSTSSSTAATWGSSSSLSSAFQFGLTPSVKNDNSQGMFRFGDYSGMSQNAGFSFNVPTKPDFAQSNFSLPSDVRKATEIQPESLFGLAVPKETNFHFATPTSSVSNKLTFGFQAPPGTIDTASTPWTGFSSVNVSEEPKISDAPTSIPNSPDVQNGDAR